MLGQIRQYIQHKFRDLRRGRMAGNEEIDPADIFLDAKNQPKFDTHRLEGRLQTPVNKKSILGLGVVFSLLLLVFVGRAWSLQSVSGQEYLAQAQQNTLRHTPIFPHRGHLYDRFGTPLAWSEAGETIGDAFRARIYTNSEGFGHILGHVSYPKKDSSGNYYRTEVRGEDGLEREMDERLSGENGLKIIEQNAIGDLISQSTIKPARSGEDITLTIDARLQNKLFSLIAETAEQHDYEGGAGVFFDIHSGEIISLVSYPEYDPAVLSRGGSEEELDILQSSDSKPFLNRATNGVFTPGSVVKPFVALGALNEGVITPEKEILSTGQMVVENPWDSERPFIYRDWKAHGWVNLVEALSVSSDVYFYQVGGGYEDQEGIGIEGINNYTRAFGFGRETGLDALSESSGTVPSREWKRENFADGAWYTGDTYITAIGQYGFTVTPLQMARAVSAIATDGMLPKPRLLTSQEPEVTPVSINIPEDYYRIVRQGMRQAVSNHPDGTANSLDVSFVDVSAKTGTAEVGVDKSRINRWVIGYYPSHEPKYAFAVVMENAPEEVSIGGVQVMNQFLRWLNSEIPGYINGEPEGGGLVDQGDM